MDVPEKEMKSLISDGLAYYQAATSRKFLDTVQIARVRTLGEMNNNRNADQFGSQRKERGRFAVELL
jgi:hypothetical protein